MATRRRKEMHKAEDGGVAERKRRYVVPSICVFFAFFGTSIASALCAPILDCDETFNYWEPTHYLNHGYGRQTWEYSPEYSIRSWLYIVLHAVPGKLFSLVFSSLSKSSEFYFVRVLLGFVYSVCATRLYAVICRVLHPALGLLFTMIMATSAGTFYASTAFLPSSFAMYASMLGFAAFMDQKRSGVPATAEGIMWFGIGAIIGWPFAGALIAPFIVEELVVSYFTRTSRYMRRFRDGILRALVVLGVEIVVDAVFYRKLVVVPLNIVAYNVLRTDDSHGPDIFGTEPWSFYVRNLLLNFNGWFVAAIVALPLTLLQCFFGDGSSATKLKQSCVRNVVFVTPFYLWLAVFTLQPHKEERFMYPAYPFLALNAAMSVHLVLSFSLHSTSSKYGIRIPVRVKAFVASTLTLTFVCIGILRIVGTITAYGAPLSVYAVLEERARHQVSSKEVLCLGKEWYRFPSSYMLPDGMHVKFIRSEFRGLLPGEFEEVTSETESILRLPPTWRVPPGMNDRNEEDAGKYVDISQCTYVVDSSLPSTHTTPLEPALVHDVENWRRVECARFLDAASTGIVGRILWLPDESSGLTRRVWGEYCLLERRTAV